MNNNYIIKRKSIKEALDHIDSFETAITKFINKHSQFSYTIDLNKDQVLDEYNIEINIKNNEKQQTNLFRETVRTHDVL